MQTPLLQDHVEEVSGEVLAVQVYPFEIEIIYFHAAARAEAGLRAKHGLVWADGPRNWTQLTLAEIQSDVIGRTLSGFSLASGRASVLVGDRRAEIIQEGPTEFIELWWTIDGAPRRVYL
ncbi:hypothetical protein ACQ5SO_16815 [Rhodovulum sp. DZ06]|uniref:hypothetical protein n=1 Tax=Rhodovulum sp. DZ06 TaxID=3425126 RepID=UPI003D33FE67